MERPGERSGALRVRCVLLAILATFAASRAAHADDAADAADCKRYLDAASEANRDAVAYAQTNDFSAACAESEAALHSLLKAKPVCKSLDELAFSKLELHQLAVLVPCRHSCSQMLPMAPLMTDADASFVKSTCRPTKRPAARCPPAEKTPGSTRPITCSEIRSAVACGKARVDVAKEMKVSKLTVDRCIAAGQR